MPLPLPDFSGLRHRSDAPIVWNLAKPNPNWEAASFAVREGTFMQSDTTDALDWAFNRGKAAEQLMGEIDRLHDLSENLQRDKAGLESKLVQAITDRGIVQAVADNAASRLSGAETLIREARMVGITPEWDGRADEWLPIDAEIIEDEDGF
jgi:hypothetical protein